VTVFGLSLAVAAVAVTIPCCVVWSRWWVRDRRRRRRRLTARELQAALIEARMRRLRMRLGELERDEESVRGLGDPAVTGSAPGTLGMPFAGDPVARGQAQEDT
jgi:hypothetical protein